MLYKAHTRAHTLVTVIIYTPFNETPISAPDTRKRY